MVVLSITYIDAFLIFFYFFFVYSDLLFCKLYTFLMSMIYLWACSNNYLCIIFFFRSRRFSSFFIVSISVNFQKWKDTTVWKAQLHTVFFLILHSNTLVPFYFIVYLFFKSKEEVQNIQSGQCNLSKYVESSCMTTWQV